jgi:hypothetical protein
VKPSGERVWNGSGQDPGNRRSFFSFLFVQLKRVGAAASHPAIPDADRLAAQERLGDLPVLINRTTDIALLELGRGSSPPGGAGTLLARSPRRSPVTSCIYALIIHSPTSGSEPLPGSGAAHPAIFAIISPRSLHDNVDNRQRRSFI